jgi:hypothetical protein
MDSRFSKMFKEEFKWMVNLTDTEKRRIKFVEDAEVLGEMFDWSLAPQGREYWEQVNNEYYGG